MEASLAAIQQSEIEEEQLIVGSACQRLGRGHSARDLREGRPCRLRPPVPEDLLHAEVRGLL